MDLNLKPAVWLLFVILTRLITFQSALGDPPVPCVPSFPLRPLTCTDAQGGCELMKQNILIARVWSTYRPPLGSLEVPPLRSGPQERGLG